MDNDGVLDDGELFDETDEDGRYSIGGATESDKVTVLAKGAIDAWGDGTPITDELILTAPAGASVVTPLTTLIDKAGMDATALAAALDIVVPEGLSLLTWDYSADASNEEVVKAEAASRAIVSQAKTLVDSIAADASGLSESELSQIAGEAFAGIAEAVRESVESGGLTSVSGLSASSLRNAASEKTVTRLQTIESAASDRDSEALSAKLTDITSESLSSSLDEAASEIDAVINQTLAQTDLASEEAKQSFAEVSGRDPVYTQGDVMVGLAISGTNTALQWQGTGETPATWTREYAIEATTVQGVVLKTLGDNGLQIAVDASQGEYHVYLPEQTLTLQLTHAEGTVLEAERTIEQTTLASVSQAISLDAQWLTMIPGTNGSAELHPIFATLESGAQDDDEGTLVLEGRDQDGNVILEWTADLKPEFWASADESNVTMVDGQSPTFDTSGLSTHHGVGDVIDLSLSASLIYNSATTGVDPISLNLDVLELRTSFDVLNGLSLESGDLTPRITDAAEQVFETEQDQLLAQDTARILDDVINELVQLSVVGTDEGETLRTDVNDWLRAAVAFDELSESGAKVSEWSDLLDTVDPGPEPEGTLDYNSLMSHLLPHNYSGLSETIDQQLANILIGEDSLTDDEFDQILITLIDETNPAEADGIEQISGAFVIGTDQGDVLAGSLADDRLFGGDGDDVIFGGSVPSYVLGDFTPGSASKWLIDFETGLVYDETDRPEDTDGLLPLRTLETLIAGEPGGEVIFDGMPRSTLAVDTNVLEGGAGFDAIYGGQGVDTMNGGSGNDYLDGREGADQIDGGSGNDYIHGGRGVDVLTGGSGADTFRVSRNQEDGDRNGAVADASEVDAITDFDPDSDRIDIGRGSTPVEKSDLALRLEEGAVYLVASEFEATELPYYLKLDFVDGVDASESTLDSLYSSIEMV